MLHKTADGQPCGVIREMCLLGKQSFNDILLDQVMSD